MPQSCSRGPRSHIILFSQSHPSLVLTVTGSETAFTTSDVMRSILGMSRSMPAPAPFAATFFTGQPKLMSMRSGPACSTISAACTIASGSRPYIWIATGRSRESMCSLRTVDFTSRTKASADTNSVYTRAAPISRQISRKLASVTSSIGASITGRSPNSILSILIVLGRLSGKGES